MLPNKDFDLTRFLPTSVKEMKLLGWDHVDVVLFSGDAYVDHPSFGAAVIGRTLQAAGFNVAIVPQPNWQDDLRDFKKIRCAKIVFWCVARCHGFHGQSLYCRASSSQ